MGKQGRSSGVLRSGVFEVDVGAGELRRNDQRVALEDQPFQVLKLLVERPGKIVTRAEILEKLWPAESSVDRERSLDLAIRRLRQALGDIADKGDPFEIIPGRGYRFRAKVSAGDAPRRQLRDSLRWWRSRLALTIGLAGLVAVVAYIIVTWPPGRIKLAVLPFNNLSGRPEDEHLSDGMTDEMITRLGRVQPARLGVIAATSVWPLKHTQQSIQQIGGKLGVDYVVEGGLSHEGNRVRISKITRSSAPC